MTTPLKDVHVLIPRTCVYITLHGKKNFTDGIKGKDGDIILDYSDLITWVLKIREYFQIVVGQWKKGQRGAMLLPGKIEEGGHKPKTADNL